MERNRTILIVSALISLLALALVLLALRPGATARAGRKLLDGANPVLDVRFRYDGNRFVLAGFDPTAEFALRLDGRAAPGAEPQFALFGKRIEGVGRFLEKAPGAMLFDFVGSQYAEEFEQNDGLVPMADPVYEDIQVHGGLGLHQVLRYTRPEGGRWPHWFPEGMAESDNAVLQGWVFFHDADLFFFYAVSPGDLDPDTLEACRDVIASLSFAPGGAVPDPAGEESSAAHDAGDGTDDKAPVPGQESGGAAEKDGSAEGDGPPGKGLLGGD
jgi:hypothetical protein